MSVRYNDAATVSDEHGKGVEMLRQQVVTINGSVSRTPMITEVDTIIRTVKVVPAALFTSGDIQLFQSVSGSGVATSITASFDLTSLAAYEIGELTIEEQYIDKDTTIYATTSGAAPSGSHVTVHIGWMPNLWSPDATNKTYALPN